MFDKKVLIVLCVVGLILIFTGIYYKNREQELASNWVNLGSRDDINKCIPTFADGGGPYYKLNSPFLEVLIEQNTEGESLVVQGKVLLNDCETPVANAIVDIWQANASGNYEDEWLRGKVRTDAEGNYSFTTVVPKGYGEGTGYRPPHIHFKVFIDEREIITSQMFFPESRGREGFEDFIMDLETEEVQGIKRHKGYHDIILPLSSI